MKRFLIFIGEMYENGRGLQDFETSFDTLEEGIEYLNKYEPPENQRPWGEIYDLENTVLHESVYDHKF